MLFFDEGKIKEALKEELEYCKRYSNGLSVKETQRLLNEERAEKRLVSSIISKCRDRKCPPVDKDKEFIKELQKQNIYYQLSMGKQYQAYKFGDIGYMYQLSSSGTIHHAFYYKGSYCFLIDTDCFLDFRKIIQELQELADMVKLYLREYMVGLHKIYELKKLEARKKIAELNARFPELPRMEVP